MRQERRDKPDLNEGTKCFTASDGKEKPEAKKKSMTMEYLVFEKKEAECASMQVEADNTK